MKLHLSLNVRNLADSVAFYEALFGAPAAKIKERYANFDLEQPGLKLALVEGSSTGPGALNHLGVQLESADEVRKHADRLKAAGLETAAEEGACCYAEQTKVWAKDPDGNAWEFYAVLADAEHNDVQTVCCS